MDFIKRLNKPITKFWLLFFPLIYFIKVHNKRVDFPCYYNTGERFLQGENLYLLADIWPYKYLPSTALFFTPLAFFSQGVAQVLFYILSFLAMAFTYKLMMDLLFDNKSYEKKFVIVPFLLSLRFHFYDFANLQVNALMLFLIVYGAIAISKDNVIRGAFAFMVGGIIKIIPIFLSFYFLLKKNFKAFFFILFFLAIVQVVPFMFYGQEGYFELFQNYLNLMDQSHSFYSPDRLFQSLPALIARTSEQLGILTTDKSKHLILIITIALSAVPVFLMLKSKSQNKIKTDFIVLSYCLLFYPLVNPVGWKHSHIFTVPAVTVLFYYIYSFKLFKINIFKFLISIYLILNVFSAKFIIGKKLGHSTDMLSFSVWALFTLFTLLFLTHKFVIKDKSVSSIG